MGLKFKDLSKINKWFYVSFGITALAGLLYLIIDFNIWILFLSILFLLKMMDVKSEQKAMNLINEYSDLCDTQLKSIEDLTLKLQESEEKIKSLTASAEKFAKTAKETKSKATTKKTVEKKTTTKKTTTAKKPVKKEAKKDGAK